MWLDWLFFGNGRGLASPYFDDATYWLRDTSRPRDKTTKGGRWYRWIGGFGAQLESFEWFAPRAGTERRLLNRTFRVFSTERRWFRVRASWQTVPNVREAEQIRALEVVLKQWGHGL